MANLTEALQQQIQLMGELKDKLVQELELIVASDADGLLSLISDKEKLLKQINDNDSLIKAVNNVSELTDQQRQLAEQGKELLLQCQHQTDINARTNEKNQVRIQRLRNMLIASRSKESMTYTSKGRTQGGLLGGSIKA